MKSKKHFIFFLFLTFQFTFSQNQKIIHGKITAKDASTAGIRIVNLVNESETFSNEKGEFYVVGKTDDLLVFSSTNMEPLRTLIEKQQFEKGQIFVEMIPKIDQFKEIPPTYPEIDSLTQETSTETDQTLYTSYKDINLILDVLSGVSELLTKNSQIEQKNDVPPTLEDLFNDDYYREILKIKPEKIHKFQRYANKNIELSTALHKKPLNKALVSFILFQLAFDYNLKQGKNK